MAVTVPEGMHEGLPEPLQCTFADMYGNDGVVVTQSVIKSHPDRAFCLLKEGDQRQFWIEVGPGRSVGHEAGISVAEGDKPMLRRWCDGGDLCGELPAQIGGTEDDFGMGEIVVEIEGSGCVRGGSVTGSAPHAAEGNGQIEQRCRNEYEEGSEQQVSHRHAAILSQQSREVSQRGVDQKWRLTCRDVKEKGL